MGFGYQRAGTAATQPGSTLITLVQTRSNIPGVSKDAACLEAYEWK